jgi:hypothetical protein
MMQRLIRHPGQKRWPLGAITLALCLASAALPAAAAGSCPVTIPNGSPLPPGGGSITTTDDTPPATHGNGQLWVAYLSPNGAIVVREDYVDPDGSIELKFPWARRIVETAVVDGALTGIFAGELDIDARRLDGPAASVRVHTNPQGVHVGSYIDFPATGCWEVTGTAGADSLTFVFLLLVEGQPIPNTAAESPKAPAIALGLVVTALAIVSAIDRLRSRRPG